jgi:DNA-binding NarL/FixJ family response regulator
VSVRLARKPFAAPFATGRELDLSKALGEPYDLLSALFRSSTVGVAICDRQLRFRAINDALASMNGIPAAAHIGKTLQSVLGSAAGKLLPAYEHVFATGQTLSNYEVTAKLPSRDAPGHWNESYFPIKDDKGNVQQVGAIVLELTKRNDLETSLLRLNDKLAMITSALRNTPDDLESSDVESVMRGRVDVFARSVRLLESCMCDTRAMSQILSAAPLLTAVRPFDSAGPTAGAAPIYATEQQDSDVSQPTGSLDPLSMREREIAALLANGSSNKQIASQLTISIRTVESHRARIMLKLDLRSLSDLVRYALRSNLIKP